MTNILDQFNIQQTPLPFGASVASTGVSYRIWCPGVESFQIEVLRTSGNQHTLQTTRDDHGYQCAEDVEGLAGDCYRIRMPNGDSHADPVSRSQQNNVRGYSCVVDPNTFQWTDKEWQKPPFRDLVIYEIHIGTFTPEGTFQAAISKLAELKELGIKAIELMPIADFPGQRNWGYEGVLIYAPARIYGQPDDFRAFVDAAHKTGIAVILDVVYNHMGPDGSSLMELAPDYFNHAVETPWGQAFNFDGPNSKPVRDFFVWNPVYWMTEYHIDGVRLDATHAINDRSDPHILAEISDRVHALGGYIVAEDERNEVRLIEPRSFDGFGFDAVWADDFHHSVRVSQTGEHHAYLQKFTGTLDETIDTLKYGWRFRGQVTSLSGESRGSDCGYVPPARLIHCVSNHDQVGNQAFGTRLNQIVSVASYRAISMLLCLSPYTPLIFMGQEWSASTPFLFFTDHHPELGRLVTEGRRQEFAEFPEFKNSEQREQIPDPQELSTFTKSKLNWDEVNEPHHMQIRRLYSECLKIRATVAAFRPIDRTGWEVGTTAGNIGFIRFDDPRTRYLLLFRLWPETSLPKIDLSELPLGEGFHAEFILSSNSVCYGGTVPESIADADSYSFTGPEVVLFRGVPQVA